MRSDLRALRERIRQVEAGDTPLRRAYNHKLRAHRTLRGGGLEGLSIEVRHYLDTHGMAGCFCNHSKDPNATISWTLVSAEDAPLHALVPTIVSLRRIEAGEFVMLDYGVRYNMDAAHCQ